MIFSPADAHKKPDEMDRNGGEEQAPQPFDTSDLETIPEPECDDPPYRDWWVVDFGS